MPTMILSGKMDGHYSITAGGLRGHHLLAFSSQGFLMDGPLKNLFLGLFYCPH